MDSPRTGLVALSEPVIEHGNDVVSGSNSPDLVVEAQPVKRRRRDGFLRGIQRISSSSSLALTRRSRQSIGLYPTRARASFSCISFASAASAELPTSSLPLTPVEHSQSHIHLYPHLQPHLQSPPHHPPISSSSSCSTKTPDYFNLCRPSPSQNNGLADTCIRVDNPGESTNSSACQPCAIPLSPSASAIVSSPSNVNTPNSSRRLILGNFWASLPRELCLYILSFLMPLDLVRASLVSRSFYADCFNGQLWTTLDASDFYNIIPAQSLAKIITTSGPFIRDLNLRGCVQVEHQGHADLIARACSNLIGASLEGCRNLRTCTITTLLSNNQGLTSLNLTGLPAVNDTSCAAIAACCHQLEQLNLSWCRGVSAIGIRLVVLACQRLRDLRLGELRGFNQPEVALTLFRTNSLERLVLSGCSDLTDDVLRLMLHGRPNTTIDRLTHEPLVAPRRLRHVDLSRCTLLTNDGVQSLGSVCPDLEVLVLSGCRILTDEALQSVLATSPRLTHLWLEDLSNLTNKLFSDHLARSPCAAGLRHLSVSYCVLLDDQGIRPVLSSCTSLSTIELDNTLITDATLSHAATSVKNRPSLEPCGGTRARVGLHMVVYDCSRVLWTGIRHILWHNASLDFQADIITIRCFYGYQMTVDEHTRRVLHGDRPAANRLERKWADYMQASEEAGVPGIGSHMRRRRARETQLAHADEANAGFGGDAEPATRWRSRPGVGCVLM